MSYTLIIEKSEEGGFFGSIVELPGCYSEGETIDALINNIKEAAQLYLETEKPEKASEFVGIQKVTL